MNRHRLLFFAALMMSASGVAFGATDCPQPQPNLCTLFRSITGTFADLAVLLEGLALAAGFAMGGLGVWKFKGHSDNPHHVPLMVPIAWFFCGVLLVSVDLVLGSGITTIFGDGTAVQMAKIQGSADPWKTR